MIVVDSLLCGFREVFWCIICGRDYMREILMCCISTVGERVEERVNIKW
jgi:hypothetical protein